jgi:DNA-binding transcriptional MerR regulator
VFNVFKEVKMRIKEVEENVGITSKNIRFYEKEGLIYPERNFENGYREYSENDIRKLKEIKLFRQLGISIEDIRLLQSQEIELEYVLENQIDKFNNQIKSLNEAKKLCSEMAEKNISFNEVIADLWLTKIKELEGKGAKFMNIDNDEIIRFLPDKFRMQYYESIIKNGQIDNTLLKEIINYSKSRGYNFNTNATVIFSGGGSLLLKNSIQFLYPNAIIEEDAQYANVQSFLNIGEIKLG